MLSGQKKYDVLKEVFSPVLREINDLIDKGSINIDGVSVRIYFILGGDYKLVLQYTTMDEFMDSNSRKESLSGDGDDDHNDDNDDDNDDGDDDDHDDNDNGDDDDNDVRGYNVDSSVN
uniref:Uncharacterized protein n=1 Tax=Amphimedon queenslandica TaxID=400682 RepID=A0A1X7T3M5_AMPQE